MIEEIKSKTIEESTIDTESVSNKNTERAIYNSWIPDDNDYYDAMWERKHRVNCIKA